jgi:geranylgeranyl pyrophosphate synthase
MVGGQCADLAVDLAALQESERLAAVIDVHTRKTAALFGAACEMGCEAAGADGVLHAREYGYQLGMLFQATDDVIDVTGTAAGIGKTPGKDADLDRPTLVAALGLDGAKARADLHASAALSAASALGLPSDHHACSLVAFLTSRTS